MKRGPEVVADVDIVRIGHRDGENVVFPFDGDDLVGLGHQSGDLVDDVGRDLHVHEIHDLHPHLGGQREEDLLARDVAELDEDVAEDAAFFPLDLKRLLDLALVDEFHLLEDLAQRLLTAEVSPAHHAGGLCRRRRLRSLLDGPPSHDAHL